MRNVLSWYVRIPRWGMTPSVSTMLRWPTGRRSALSAAVREAAEVSSEHLERDGIAALQVRRFVAQERRPAASTMHRHDTS